MTKEIKSEETVEEVVETVEKDDNEKTAEELKAEAEAVEAEIKQAKENKDEEEIRQNYLKRLQKAREKKELYTSEPVRQVEKKEDLDVRDLLVLDKNSIPEDSDKAKLLKRYKDAGIIASYAEGLEHVGVKAELEALEAKANAHSIIDGNADEESVGLTTKEVIRKYKTTGQAPSDPKLQEVVARNSLREMGLL